MIFLADSLGHAMSINTLTFQNVSFNTETSSTFLHVSATKIIFSDLTLELTHPHSIVIKDVDELSFVNCHLYFHQVNTFFYNISVSANNRFYSV